MEKKKENKILLILSIILLLSIFSYIIYLMGILIYDANNINYNNHNTNMVELDNSSSRPVKGMYDNNDSIIQHRADSITHYIDSINKHILDNYHKKS